MFIQTEDTPNPRTMKFLPGQAVTGGEIVNCPDKDSAQRLSPLARALFEIEGVEGVMLGADFISVTCHEAEQWYLLKPAILGVVMEHFVTRQPILHDTEPASQAQSILCDPEDQPIVDQICELLETRVRPFVQSDGGDIVFHGFKQGVVYLTMRGACAGCPSSTATLKMGIENLLRHYIPEVQEVRPTL